MPPASDSVLANEHSLSKESYMVESIIRSMAATSISTAGLSTPSLARIATAKDQSRPKTLDRIPYEIQCQIWDQLRDSPVSSLCAGLTCKALRIQHLRVHPKFVILDKEECHDSTDVKSRLHYFIRRWMWDRTALVWGGKYNLRFITLERRDEEEKRIVKVKEKIRMDLLEYRIDDRNYTDLMLMSRFKAVEWRMRGRKPTKRQRAKAAAVSRRAEIMVQAEKESVHSEVLKEVFGQENPHALFDPGRPFENWRDSLFNAKFDNIPFFGPHPRCSARAYPRA